MGDAYEYCKRCHPGPIAPMRMREWVRDATRAWQELYGTPPSSTDWSWTPGAVAAKRSAIPSPKTGPPPSTVIDISVSWPTAHADAFANG
jgi:hypothetical protein